MNISHCLTIIHDVDDASPLSPSRPPSHLKLLRNQRLPHHRTHVTRLNGKPRDSKCAKSNVFYAFDKCRPLCRKPRGLHEIIKKDSSNDGEQRSQPEGAWRYLTCATTTAGRHISQNSQTTTQYCCERPLAGWIWGVLMVL
jgi:hypothetical protein